MSGSGEALVGKVVLVSGGTQGLGAAVARVAAREGASVAVIGRRTEVGEAFAAELAEKTARVVFFTPADVGDVARATLAVRRTVERFGRVDCLVNVAGFTDRGSLVDTTPELFDRHIAVNLKAPFFLMQAAVTDMRRRQEPGSIVNVISMSAHGPAVPGGVRRREGRARRPHPKRGARPPLGPDPDQRPQHRVDPNAWRGRDPATVPRRRGRLGRPGRIDPPDGSAR